MKILAGLFGCALFSAAFNGGMSLLIGVTLGQTAQWIYVPVAVVIGGAIGFRYMAWAWERWA